MSQINAGSAMSPVLNLGITTFIFVWLSTFSRAKWLHIKFQKRTVRNFSLQHLKWHMKNAIPHLVLFFIATVERNIPLTGFNSFCINTIRSNPFLSPASRMITRSQNHSSHRWKKKNSTERTILPIEHFKPALLRILNFIILSDLITHWKIWHHARWKRASVQLLNETSVFESPDLFVFDYILRRFAFSCLIFDLACQPLKALSCQGIRA